MWCTWYPVLSHGRDRCTGGWKAAMASSRSICRWFQWFGFARLWCRDALVWRIARRCIPVSWRGSNISCCCIMGWATDLRCNLCGLIFRMSGIHSIWSLWMRKTTPTVWVVRRRGRFLLRADWVLYGVHSAGRARRASFHTILAFALTTILPPAPKLSFAKYKPVVSLSGKAKVFRCWNHLLF